MAARNPTRPIAQQPALDWDAATIELARILARSLARKHHAEEQARQEQGECE